MGVFMRVPSQCLHALEDSLCDLRCSVEGGELDVLLLAEMHADQRVEAVQQLLQRLDVLGIRLLEPVDPPHDCLVVVHHRDGCVSESDELRPLRVEHLLFGLRVRDERAAQELDDPADKQLPLCAVEARDLARGLPDVLDVEEQLFVLSSERLWDASSTSLLHRSVLPQRFCRSVLGGRSEQLWDEDTDQVADRGRAVPARPVVPHVRACACLDVSKQARLFAKFAFASGDAVIACWESKAHWSNWRPQRLMPNAARN